jgi:Htaa protein
MTALRRSLALAIGVALLVVAPSALGARFAPVAHPAPAARSAPAAPSAVARSAPTGPSASASQAPERTGATTIDLGGKAVERLRAAGVTIAAKRPARLARGVLRLPVAHGLVSDSAYLNHGGAVVLRRRVDGRRHTLAIAQLQTRLGRTSRIIGSLGGRRFTIFSIVAPAADLRLNAGFGSASLHGARVVLSRRAAAAIKRRLMLRRLPAGRFGGAAVDALVGGSKGGAGGGGSGGGAPGGGGPPASGPILEEPPLLPRPAGAVDVGAATLTWHVRDSWIRYVSTQKPVEPLGPAVPGAAIEGKDHPCPDVVASPGPLVYSYTLPVVGGWHDPVSGATALYSAGGARFVYPAHGIDLDVTDLEVDLNGAAARVIARFDGRGDTQPGNKRGVLVDLAATPVPPGTPALIKATIPTGGSQSVFAGYYSPGEGFGCVSVSYTTP